MPRCSELVRSALITGDGSRFADNAMYAAMKLTRCQAMSAHMTSGVKRRLSTESRFELVRACGTLSWGLVGFSRALGLYSLPRIHPCTVPGLSEYLGRSGPLPKIIIS